MNVCYNLKNRLQFVEAAVEAHSTFGGGLHRLCDWRYAVDLVAQNLWHGGKCTHQAYHQHSNHSKLDGYENRNVQTSNLFCTKIKCTTSMHEISFMPKGRSITFLFGNHVDLTSGRSIQGHSYGHQHISVTRSRKTKDPSWVDPLI